MNLLSYDWDFSILITYLPVILNGIKITLELTILSIVCGTILGLAIGIYISKYNKFVPEFKWILILLIDLVRATPMLILLLLFNYYVSFLTSIKSPFWLSFLALSINLAAVIADIVRGSLNGVFKPFIEAGMVLGMDRPTIFRRIILPEGVRAIIPTLTTLYIEVLKLSSLASALGVDELTHVSSQISASTFRNLEVFAVVTVIYILLVLPFSNLIRHLEKSKWFLRRS